MPPSRRVGYAIHEQSNGYFVKVSIKGRQGREVVSTIEEARELRDQLVALRSAGFTYEQAIAAIREGYPADRLPLIQPQEGDPAMETDTGEIEIPEALRPAYDALIGQRDQMMENAAPLRETLAQLDQGLERVQTAIDALEGREPDASAALRAPGSLKDNLPQSVRDAFRAPAKREVLSRPQSEALRAAVLNALPTSEDAAASRSEVTKRTNNAGLDFGPITRDQVSRQLLNLIDAGLAARNNPPNPKEIRYWRIDVTTNRDTDTDSDSDDVDSD